MVKILKTLIKKHIPKDTIYQIQKSLKNLRSIKARKIFKHSSSTPSWLNSMELENLFKRYTFPSEYGYEHETLRLRGEQRAAEILRFIENRKPEFSNFLELACCDGMVSCALQLSKKNTTAIDIQAEGFDQRGKSSGVSFLKMNAADLQFHDKTFDFVFSYAAFEHFEEPENVLKEAIRVTKSGGYIYFNFGPLYMSPFGLHVYRSIPVPYCQVLFSPDVITDFAEKKNINPPNYKSLNNWSLTEYRNLWDRYSQKLHLEKYYEHINVSHLDLIAKYPSCFKSKTDCFDDLTVAEIEVLFIKK